MYLSEILPGNWREGEWPEHIEVSHESSRFKSRRYVPRVNSVNKSSANPVDGISGNWCCVAQCDDGQTAITVADALQNFMRTGLIGDDFHTRTRLVGEKGA